MLDRSRIASTNTERDFLLDSAHDSRQDGHPTSAIPTQPIFHLEVCLDGLVAAADVETNSIWRNRVFVGDYATDRHSVAKVVVRHERSSNRRVVAETVLDLLDSGLFGRAKDLEWLFSHRYIL